MRIWAGKSPPESAFGVLRGGVGRRTNGTRPLSPFGPGASGVLFLGRPLLTLGTPQEVVELVSKPKSFGRYFGEPRR